MFTEPKPTKAQQPLTTFYVTPSGRVSVASNPQVRKMYIRLADKDHVLDVSSISKDYIRRHADQIDALVAWVEQQVRNELPGLGPAEVEIVERTLHGNVSATGT